MANNFMEQDIDDVSVADFDRNSLSSAMPGSSRIMPRELLTDTYSQKDVVNILVKDLGTQLSEVKSFKFSKPRHEGNSSVLPTKSRSRSMEQTLCDPDHSEMLDNKKQYVEQLTTTIESSPIIGVPQFNAESCEDLQLHMHKKLSAAKEMTKENGEKLKELQMESNQLDEKYDIFSKLVGGDGDEDQLQSPQNEDKSIQLFQEAKKDLATIMQFVCPNEETRRECERVITRLMAAREENDDIEGHYIELPADLFGNHLFRCLVEACVIDRHSRYPEKYRLCVDDDD